MPSKHYTRGHTWKKVDKSSAEEIRRYLLESGGAEQKVKSPNEGWRIRFSDSTFTYYKSGTIYSTPSRSLDPRVFNVWEYIDSIVGPKYIPPSREFLIGLDETGKGEVIGHTILAGVLFPKKIFNELKYLIGPADTKKKRSFEYWDELFRDLDQFRESGLNFIVETIPPWHVDKYNLNKIMDVVYQRILSVFFREIDISKCRIVLDDYGIGPTLGTFFNFLRRQGAEVNIVPSADEKYLEVKVASVIAKRERENVIKRINENPEFRIEGLSVGSGNANDKQTLDWLKKWHSAGKEWPWFVKRSFRTIREIEGKTGKINKEVPPIDVNLLSKDFIDNFNKGKLSIRSLSVVCPYCGKTLKAGTFAIYKDETGRKVSGLKCPSCKKIIKHAGITLRYYCGYVVPDSNIIRRGTISKDLESSKFFEGFSIVLSPVVRKECNKTKAGKKELDKLARFASMGRIRLESPGSVEEIPDKLSSTARDERIAKTALEYNAILMTDDNGLKSYAISKEIFTIFI